MRNAESRAHAAPEKACSPVPTEVHESAFSSFMKLRFRLNSTSSSATYLPNRSSCLVFLRSLPMWQTRSIASLYAALFV